MLIRWLGTEIRVFAYLGNLILVVCFFGVGLGCYRQAQAAALDRLGLNLLLLGVFVANPFRLECLNLKWASHLLGSFEDSPLWEIREGGMVLHAAAGLAIVGMLVYLVTMTFVPAGQMLGHAFERHPRVIRAYSVNIVGSLAGGWLFNVLSWSSSPPPVWFAAAAVLLACLVVSSSVQRGWLTVALVGLATVAVWAGQTTVLRTVWSPYHKLTLEPLYVTRGTNQFAQGYQVEVNGTHYQEIRDLSLGFYQSHPGMFDMELARRGAYDLPFCFKRHIRRMLVVGAGAGNNAAAALRHGVEQVDCVEIDPQIYALGRELHPEHPYQSPRVHMVLDDARAFFKHATGPYDAIWFGWLDSHTLGSSYNNMRLDHYVYTLESLREARALLADDGIVILNFAAERRWIADRLSAVLREAFGHKPFVYAVHNGPAEYGTVGFVTLIAAEKPVTTAMIEDPALRRFVEGVILPLPGETRITTDDWPYLYLQNAKVPKLHLLATLTILSVVGVAARRMFAGQTGFDWHFFALGAAFLLLEVQTVSRATLLFGMTWTVNAIVISAVLVMVLVSNLVASRWPRLPAWVPVVGLAGSMVALAIVPLDWFNALAGAGKLVTASAFLTAPVFFAGLIFIRSFTVCADKSRALGSNLIGALVGGLLESVSFVTGIRALVLLVGAFYVFALLVRPRLAQNLQAADQCP
jgi:hypothetical protein